MFTRIKYRRRLLQSWRLFTDWVPRGKLWLLTILQLPTPRCPALHCVDTLSSLSSVTGFDSVWTSPATNQAGNCAALPRPHQLQSPHLAIHPSLPPSYLLSFISCCLWWIFWLPRLCVQQVLMMVIKIWLRITIKTTFMVFIFLWFAS